MIAFTSICANYIPKAMVLAESFKQHHPQSKFIICLVENTTSPVYKKNKFVDKIILAKNLRIKNFHQFIFKYNQVEASTAIKGYAFNKLYRLYPQEKKFLYLDPDILIMAPLNEVDNALSSHDIIVAPHLCEPEDKIDAIIDNEMRALKCGIFNLGFLGLRKSKASQKFLDWWTKRLHQFCYIDFPSGLFTDQKWMDLALCFFNVHILKHLGYNVAHWNLSQRPITKLKTGHYLVKNHPLIFFHFSGWDSGEYQLMITKYKHGQQDPVLELRNLYAQLLLEQNKSPLGSQQWSYSKYNNGARVQNQHRFLYRSPSVQKKFAHPFDEYTHPSFYKYVTNLFLKYRSLIPYKELIPKLSAMYKIRGRQSVLKDLLQYALNTI